MNFSISAFVALVLVLAINANAIPTFANEVKNNIFDEESESTTDMEKQKLPDIPVGLTSFGGAIANGSLFVFGGHCGDAHEYYKEVQNAKLYRLDLKSPKQWEMVDDSSGLQGLAMVAHKESLYRVGGFAAHNAKDAEQDLRSVAEFARFDFKSGKWIPLKPMPTPRSSLDAVVVDDTLYVMGGWALNGKDSESKWSEDMVSIDLSDENANWQTIKVPFQRRALSAGFQDGKLYAVGGMQKQGGPTRSVSVYDLKTKTWSDGPEIPGSEAMEGFGNSCFNVGGRLIVNTYGGYVYKLSKDGDDWGEINQLSAGRFFHRLLPYSKDHFLLVGGANMETGKVLDVQVHRIED